MRQLAPRLCILLQAMDYELVRISSKHLSSGLRCNEFEVKFHDRFLTFFVCESTLLQITSKSTHAVGNGPRSNVHA